MPWPHARTAAARMADASSGQQGVTMPDLRQVLWMKQQWQRFCRLLLTTVAVVWLLCCAGILLAPIELFWMRMGLLFMLLATTLYGIRLAWTAWRELRALDRQAERLRATQILEKQPGSS